MVSGGAKLDEVVILSTQASWNSVHDFQAKKAQNARVRASTSTLRARLMCGGSSPARKNRYQTISLRAMLQ